MPGTSTWITQRMPLRRAADTVSQYNVNFVQCNEGQCNLGGNAAGLTRGGCPRGDAKAPGDAKHRPAANRVGSLPRSRPITPGPGSGRDASDIASGLQVLPQVLGLVASIAARLTIWPISLACSASDRICACTYSLCSRIISAKSLAWSSDCA